MKTRISPWAQIPAVMCVVASFVGSAFPHVPFRSKRLQATAHSTIDTTTHMHAPKVATTTVSKPDASIASAPNKVVATPLAAPKHAANTTPVRVCRKRGMPVPQPLLTQCDVHAMQRVRSWSPDAVVVLGGGILLDGKENCATAQRAHAAWDLVSKAGLDSTIVLSGRGPVRELRTLDSAERLCVRERLVRESHQRGLSPQELARFAMRISRVETQSRGAPTESDLMCAAMLREVPEAQRLTALSRMTFESRSKTTIENAEFTTPLLARRHFRRVLLLTTPVVHRRKRLDNHPARALGDFRRARAKTRGRFELGAVGCPFVGGGPNWLSIEERDRLHQASQSE